MIKLKKKFIFAVFLILIFLISGCNIGKKDTKKSLEEIRTGTEGISISFLPNAPPETIHVEQGIDSAFDVVLELKNKGAYPQPNEGTQRLAPGFSNLFLSGYDIISFKGTVKSNSLNVEKYEPTLLATACYYYSTVAGPSVCIDPNPYSTIKENKVCTVQGLTLSNQGAPIAVTKIDEEAFSTKTQFRITIKNVGGGDVLKEDALSDKCNPSGDAKIEREDIDKVYIGGVKISDKNLDCGPFSDGAIKGTIGYIRLINGEGFVICELPKSAYSNQISAYTTPLLIQLTYGYRNTIQKKILIKKEGGSSIGGVSDGESGGFSVPSPPSPQEQSVITV